MTYDFVWEVICCIGWLHVDKMHFWRQIASMEGSPDFKRHDKMKSIVSSQDLLQSSDFPTLYVSVAMSIGSLLLLTKLAVPSLPHEAKESKYESNIQSGILSKKERESPRESERKTLRK